MFNIAQNAKNSFSHTINATLYMHKTLIPSKMTISGLFGFSADDYFSTDEVNELLHRKNRFILKYLNRSVFIDSENVIAKEIFLKNYKSIVDNNVVLIPSNLSDAAIASTIFRKLHALGEGRVIYDTISVVQSGGGDEFGIQKNPTKNDLEPVSMLEWIGPTSFHKKPWFDRTDYSTVDLVPTESDYINVEPSYVPEELVEKRTGFVPTVFDGGK